MKDKDKIVGSTAILVLGIIFLITGYFLSKTQEKDSKNVLSEDIFIEQSMDKSNYEQICSGDSIEKEKDGLTNIEQNTVVKGASCEEIGIIKSITVDIKGEVKKPGVYTMEEGDRISDLIELAGGLTKEADTLNLNLAQKLHDEACIYVRKIGEENRNDIPFSNGKIGDSASINGISSSKSKKININTAPLEELKTLPGIGDVIGQNIISYREEHNGFKSVEELTNVSKIGAKTLEKFVDMVDIK